MVALAAVVAEVVAATRVEAAAVVVVTMAVVPVCPLALYSKAARFWKISH